MRTNVVATAARLLFGMLVVFLSSEIATAQEDRKPLGDPHPEKALVYMVRQGEFAGSGRTERVFVEDTLIGVLPNRTYTFTHVEPGTHLLWASFHKEPLMVDLAPGQTYYLVFKLSERLALVPVDQGAQAIAKSAHYRTMDDEDREKGGREAKEKWPERRTKYAERLALGSADRTYQPPASTDGMVKVPVSTEIGVELMENLTSAVQRFGEHVWVRVSGDVIVNERVVVPKGAAVKALVRDAKNSGGFGKAGVVDIGLFSVTAVDGTACPIIGQVFSRGKTEGTGVESFFGGILGAYLVKGGQGYVPAGSSAVAYTQTDVWIKPPVDEPSAVRDAESTEAPVKASAGGPVACELSTGRGPEKLAVAFAATDLPREIRLAGVLGSQLPKPVSSLAVTLVGGTVSADFAGADICRYLRDTSGGTVLAFELIGTDGSVRRAEGNFLISLIGGKKK
jgi:hypothetical protein